jgi:chitodextrinase
MLDPDFKVVGIGRSYNSASAYGWYWTFDFGDYADQILNVTPPPPAVAVFMVLGATTLTPGQSTMLLWSVSGASTVTINNGVGDVTNTTSKTVSPTQTTTYMLTATNAGGSATARLTVGVTGGGGGTVDTTPPTNPTLLSATAKKPAEVDLAWSASTDNVGVAGYQILRNGSIVTSVAGGILSYADTTVSANTTYSYSIKAYDAAGNYSNASNSIQVTTPAVVVAPPVVSTFAAAPSSVVTGQSATLSWTVSGASSVSVDNGIGTVSNVASKTVSPTQTTTYTLTAANSGGTTTARVTVTVSGPDTQPPATPILSSAFARSATEVDLAWGASADNVGVAGYQIIRSGAMPVSVSGATLSYSDMNASPSTTYLYFIKAYDAAGNYSGASNTIQVVTPASSSGTPCPSAGAGIFTGCYFNNINLSGNPAFIRTDSQINFNWGNGSPDKSLSVDNFSVRWEGSFTFNQGTYTFAAVTSDGMRVYIDGAIVLDQWHDQGASTYTFSAALGQGSHLIVVESYEHTGTSVAQLSWH